MIACEEGHTSNLFSLVLCLAQWFGSSIKDMQGCFIQSADEMYDSEHMKTGCQTLRHGMLRRASVYRAGSNPGGWHRSAIQCSVRRETQAHSGENRSSLCCKRLAQEIEEIASLRSNQNLQFRPTSSGGLKTPLVQR